jgi:septal ring factor EnvC (AmiA/AmiB activator)
MNNKIDNNKESNMTELIMGTIVGAAVAGGAAYMLNKNNVQQGSESNAEHLQREIERLKDLNKKQEEQIASMNQRAKEYSYAQRNTDDELNQLEDELDKAKKRLRELETQNKEYETRIADYKAEIAQYKTELEAYKN